MKVCILGSGSSGNSIYVESSNTRLLVDAGLSAKEIERRLHELDAAPGSLSAIVVSHEHVDHIRGAGVLARRYGLPLWGNPLTLAEMSPLFNGSERLEEFSNGDVFRIGDLLLRPFSVSHDAADPSQFLVTDGQASVGIATDLGFVSRLVRQRLGAADLVILESNHDEQMLLDGPYPWPLKQRIKGRKGHLSNQSAAEALALLASKGLTRAVLAHLSEENNRPEVALETSKAELRRVGARGFQIMAAQQHCVSAMITV